MLCIGLRGDTERDESNGTRPCYCATNSFPLDIVDYEEIY